MTQHPAMDSRRPVGRQSAAMKRLAALFVALLLAACSHGGSTGSAHDVSIQKVGSAGYVVRFTIDHPADCAILGHGIVKFPAGVNSYDVPAGATVDDAVDCD